MAQPGAQQQGGQPGSSDTLGEFRSAAQILMALGKKYPEAAPDMAQALKAIQGAMTKVAGNPQRTQEAQVPPQA
jgi:hypothetical protein